MKNVSLPQFPTMGAGAEFWFNFGYQPFPAVPHQKRPAVRLNRLRDKLSHEMIARHWTAHPDHEVGFVLDKRSLVLDADSPESLSALYALETRYGIIPCLVVKTLRGEHHHFGVPDSVFVKTSCHGTVLHPERIDVKAGPSQAILPPSTNKSILVLTVAHRDDLSQVTQEFIDAVFDHNGQEAPRPRPPIEPRESREFRPTALPEIAALLVYIDPDCGYDPWVHVLMAIHTESGGSEDGLALAIDWSSRGDKYKGPEEIELKWKSFDLGRANPVTIATLIAMVRDAGKDPISIMSEAEPFEPCETIVVQSGDVVEISTRQTTPESHHPLRKYSLSGRLDAIRSCAENEIPFLFGLALMGQLTVFYASPNTGKTLVTMAGIVWSIAKGQVDPSCVYYVNMDDTGQGLIAKLEIADEYEFHMLAEGHQNFSANKLRTILEELTRAGIAKGVVVVIDTLKKMVNLMDKTEASNISSMLRRFSAAGGTVIALAHANKRTQPDGRPTYGGTSDIRDDFDCAYIIAPVGPSSSSTEKVVEFENIKRRGDVPDKLAFSYDNTPATHYAARMASVEVLDADRLDAFRVQVEVQNDIELIGLAKACILEGTVTKMKLASAIAERYKCSRNSALALIDKYTGDDPVQHRWTYKIGERGAKIFALLGDPPPAQS